MNELPIDRAKILATVQNIFFARFYSYDVFLFYRALSRQYYKSPSMAIMTASTNMLGDTLQLFGAVPPADRMIAFLDVISISWNEQMKKDLSPLFPNKGLWNGWDAFTAMLQDDLKQRPQPSPLPPQEAIMKSVKLTQEQIEKLSLSQKTAYYSYRGDIDWSLECYKNSSVYFPEFFALMHGVWWTDHIQMFEYYTNWAKEAFLAIPAKNEDRIMAKVILLSNYRFDMLMPDLLYPLHPALQTEAFRKGALDIASNIRQVAEEIIVTPLPKPLP